MSRERMCQVEDAFVNGTYVYGEYDLGKLMNCELKKNIMGAQWRLHPSSRSLMSPLCKQKCLSFNPLILKELQSRSMA